MTHQPSPWHEDSTPTTPWPRQHPSDGQGGHQGDPVHGNPVHGNPVYGTPPPSSSLQPHAPQPYAPQSYAPQPYAPQSYAPQSYAPQSYAPQDARPYAGFGGFGVADPAAPFGRDPFTGEPMSDRSKVAGGLLQLFLGHLGVGRFYLGHTGVGLAQLLLTIAGWATVVLGVGLLLIGGVALWALIDAIMILAGSVRDGRGLKLRS